MSERKNILYISFLGILDPVGFSQIYSYIIELSRAKDLKFTVLTFEKESLLKKAGYLDSRRIRAAMEKNGVEWLTLRHHGGAGKVYDFMIGLILAAVLIVRKNIKIVHARSNEPVIIAFFISRLFRIKVVYDRRGMMAEDYSDDATTGVKFRKGGLAYRSLDRFEKAIMRSSDAIVVLTRKILDHVTQDSRFKEGRNVFVIPCCVNMERFAKFSKDASPLSSRLGLEGKFVFNYTGSLCNLHSFSEILDFFKVSKKVIPNAHFIFLTMVDKKAIEDQINRKGLDIKDFTIRATYPLEINDYLAVCDASVMFFKPTFIRRAASPTKLGECLASGLPIIINKGIGDTEELIEKNRVGAVIEDFSEAAYLKASMRIVDLLKEPSIRLRCRRAAESEMALEKGVGRYRDIYDKL